MISPGKRGEQRGMGHPFPLGCGRVGWPPCKQGGDRDPRRRLGLGCLHVHSTSSHQLVERTIQCIGLHHFDLPPGGERHLHVDQYGPSGRFRRRSSERRRRVGVDERIRCSGGSIDPGRADIALGRLRDSLLHAPNVCPTGQRRLLLRSDPILAARCSD